jgi:hypothetical protein
LQKLIICEINIILGPKTSKVSQWVFIEKSLH